MDKLIALLKVTITSSFGISVFKANVKRNKWEYLKVLGIGAAIAAGFTPILLLYFKILWQGFALLAPIGQEGAILTLGIVLVNSMIFYFGIFFIINTFYFAEDTEILLTLPLRPWQVLGARFLLILFYEYLTELLFLVPPLVIFGVKSAAPAIYWIYAVLGYFLIPLFPLALASLFTMVVMRFTNLGRKKDLLKILGGILVIVLAISFQLLFQKSGPNAMDPAFLNNLLTNPNGLLNVISRNFPFTRWLALALIHSSTPPAFFYMLSFAGTSLLAVAITWLIGEKVYYRGLIGSGETTVKRKHANSLAHKQLVKVSSPTISYLIKEIRLLVRTPSYFLNCVLINFLVPVLLIIPFFLQSRNLNAPPPWESIPHNSKLQIIIMVIISSIAIFLAVTNAITATSLSREGKQFFISKYIPLPYEKQIQAKLLSGYIFGIVGTILLLLATGLLLKLGITMILIIFTITLVAILPAIEAGLLIDIYRPKLNWDNEQKAVKQNLNSVFAMLVSVFFGGCVSYPVIKYIQAMFPAILFMLFGYGMLAGLLYYILMTKGIAQYRKLEG